MNYGVVIFPGSNCDHDSYYAVNTVLNHNTEFIWHRDTQLSQYDCIILPGGFSYGDYLRPGAISRFSPIMESVIQFANNGGLVIGICNGFQILLESGLLPGAMLQNKSVHFICKHIFIKTINNRSPVTNRLKENEILNLPIAHMDGAYYCDGDTLNKLEKNGQILFKYSDETGNISEQNNPNGSLNNIAGICNENKNVFGLMPHPERAIEKILGSVDGIKIFQSIDNTILNKVA